MGHRKTQLLFVSSEFYPLVKTGGLADVSNSLPAALAGLGLDVAVLIPAYPPVLERAGKTRVLYTFADPLFGRESRLLAAVLPGSDLKLLLFDAAELYRRGGGIYGDEDNVDWPDNADRFCCFCRAGAAVALDRCGLDWQPHLVHCNDWQTGLVPAFVDWHAPADSGFSPPTLFTIHNLAYQGLFDRAAFDRLQLPSRWWSVDAMEFHHRFSFLKAGIQFADFVTTVSPTYRDETLTPEFGCGMEGVLASREDRYRGILNGVDYRIWNPETDPAIARPYSRDSLEDKSHNKLALQKKTALREDQGPLLVGMVSRLAKQKGIDVALQAMEALIEESIQWAVLGSGDKLLEKRLTRLARRYPGRVFFHAGYDESLAHRIEAGADLFLMPSRYEPCGLNQMYSLRYGTLPLVCRTGGLADTVVDASEDNIRRGTATGFAIDRADAADLQRRLIEALQMYRDRPAWRRLCRRAMAMDFSWSNSAGRYRSLYDELLIMG